jgi:hypothetical protein
MRALKLADIDLKRLSQSAAFCGAPVGGGTVGSVNLLGHPAPGETLSMALALVAFLSVGVWMFRRWGKPPEKPAAAEPSPEVATASRERELVNA